MKRNNRTNKLLLGLLVSVVVAVSASNCDKKAGSTAKSMVIVNTTGAAVVVKAGQEMDAKVGMLVAEKDVIKTQKGMVDLQTKSGSAIRVKEFTTMTVAGLFGGKSKETKLSMQHGSLMANVDKRANDESFKVTTPTAIAGVRGTTFTVESNEGEPTRVKVINGKVEMAPRFKALETLDATQENSEAVQKLKKVQEENTVYLEASTAGELQPEVEKVVREVNEKTQGSTDQKEVLAAVEKEVEKVEAVAQKQKAIEVKKEEVTTEERMEKETLVTVDDSIIEKAEAGKVDESVVAAITEERQKKQEEVIKRIETEASKTTLKNEEEIKKHYNKLEVINLKDGSSVRGAVIAQTGRVMVVHTPKGVKRIRTSDVSSITFP